MVGDGVPGKCPGVARWCTFAEAVAATTRGAVGATRAGETRRVVYSPTQRRRKPTSDERTPFFRFSAEG